MTKHFIFFLILVFPVILFSQASAGNSDEQKIKNLVNDFYSSSGDDQLNQRFELLCEQDKKILVKDRIIDIWAHQLHSIRLKKIKKVTLKATEAEVWVELDIKSMLGEADEQKVVPVYVRKENDRWKIAYLYFQPPLFTTYP
jgi:hypothetical protein